LIDFPDPDASAYELLFSFSSPEEKNEFLNLVRSNEDMGNDYVIEFTLPKMTAPCRKAGAQWLLHVSDTDGLG
jgi:hypothetical protein